MFTSLDAALVEITRLQVENRRLEAQVAELLPPVVLTSDLDRRVALEYRDAGGKASQREVTIQQIIGHRDGRPTAVKGYCHLRQMARSFALDRITRVADPATGELIHDLVAYVRVPR